ncbi:site-specific integrase [Gimesia aquarii]|uniref:Phage integrase family protein n=1 Tax=Gimesia aquarii TaxID=2527964 RepID=A0A517VP65_9PLAN|nr:tyrosine-type recombinase/integrase [Gimesia aquarii]QDT94799.1 Phage integrase family protein [Gimesia aquarii]
MQQIRKDELYWPVYRDMYLQRLQVHNKDKTYVDNVRRTLDRFGTYSNLTMRLLVDVTNHDLELYLKRRQDDSWRGKPLSNVTLNNELGHICTCLAKAGPRENRGPNRGNYGFLECPPYIDLLEVDETDPEVITEDQIKRFSNATRYARSPRVTGCTPAEFWQAVLLLGLVTGLRRRGLLLIERPSDEMLIEKRELFLPAKYHKTRNSLRIPLGSAEVVSILAKLPSKEGEPLLPWKDEKTGRSLSLAYFSNTMTRIQREAGISEGDRIKTKNLRSTAATIIAEQHGDDVAKKRLGHSPNSKTLLTNYKAKRVSDADRQASEMLGELVLPHMTDHGLKIFGA